jgi:hypothetical protein
MSVWKGSPGEEAAASENLLDRIHLLLRFFLKNGCWGSLRNSLALISQKHFPREHQKFKALALVIECLLFLASSRKLRSLQVAKWRKFIWKPGQRISITKQDLTEQKTQNLKR